MRGRDKYIFSRIVLVLILVFNLFVVTAQETTFSAKAPKVVRSGEQFQVVYTIVGDYTGFNPPALAPFNVLSGPNQSRSSNFEFRNGKSTSYTQTTYSYWLQASSTGTFTIEPATVIINKKEKKQSNKLNIQVVAGKTSPNAGQPSSNTNSRSQVSQQSPTGSVTGEDVFVRTEASKRRVYIGEQFVVSEKIYSRLPVAGFGDVKFPNYSGFWSQEVDIPDRINLERVAVNNQVYSMGEIKRTVLFPQKSGTITLEPSEVEVVVQVRDNSPRRRTGNPFVDDPFFNPRVSNVPVASKSKPVSITVMPLPEEGKPADFAGAVGQFTISSSIDKTSLSTNEAITLRYKISGTGNLPLIDLENLRFPPDFEVYDPKVTKNIRTTTNAVTGTITFEYVLIPRSAGSFSIPAVKLVYFDPEKETYVSLRSSDYLVDVAKGDQDEGLVYQGLAKEDVEIIGEDIRYIKKESSSFRPVNATFFASGKWYLLIIVIVLVNTGVFVILSIRRKKQADIVGMKNRKATKLAKRRLKLAEKLLNESKVEQFYEEVSSALWGYMSDKLNIPTAYLNTEKVKLRLDERGLDTVLSEKFFEIVSHCDYARFAPGDLSSGMQNLYNESVDLITMLEKSLKQQER
ncbi:MAG: hypothetical protein C0593_00760 [Marinilabiliales bacterium]|nr:MAG: hypothetical protein C0593_00760 [Marinilabiliales bacterium]